MKIAITSSGETMESVVDPRFGRAAFFAVVDTETMDFLAAANDNIMSAGGAGIGAGKKVSELGVEAVLTGNCGPNAERTLTAAGIKIYCGVSGSVAQAVEAFKAGELQAADGPTVQSHFGSGS